MRTVVLSVALGVLLALLSFGVWPFLSSMGSPIFVIPTMVLLLTRARFSRVLACALAFGLLCDSYSLYSPEFYTLRLVILVSIGFWTFQHWFTNRSVYTAVALTALLTFLDRLIAWIFHLFTAHSVFLVWSWRHEFLNLVSNTVFAALLFFLLVFFTQRLSLSGFEHRRSSWYG